MAATGCLTSVIPIDVNFGAFDQHIRGAYTPVTDVSFVARRLRAATLVRC